jgi:hypothetical protein
MAYNETEVPEGVRDILAYMPREMRQRVLADYESHYAPFLSMLAGWKGAVQAHYAQGEASAIARLEEQFFPLGDWKFPAQGLAVPQRPPERTTDIVFGAQLQDPAKRPWMASGDGWLQPTALRGASFQWVDQDGVFVLDAEYLGGGSLDAVLQRGQLAFIAAPEEVVAAMEAGAWWVQTRDQEYRRARLQRYDGYMAFEREMQTARMNQRQLDLWLPAFYPYSRKVVCLGLAVGEDADTGVRPDFGWLPDLRGGFRFVGMLRSPDRQVQAALRREEARRGGHALVHLNAVPVVQAAALDSTIPAPFPRVGTEYALRTDGVPGIFAAVAYSDNVTVPTSLFRVPANDPAATEPDVEVRFAQADTNVARIKLYYNSFGQEQPDNSDTPSSLEMTPLRFDVPFRVVGGVTLGAPDNRAEWARTAWYHSVLRPPLLTEGDLLEIIRQRSKGSLADALRFRYATREIVQDPDEGSAHWRSYLWPSIVAKEDHFDARYGEIPAANYVPLVQSLRIAFERRAGGPAVPDFLLADWANYLASVLSQYFVLSCFRVEGRVV